MGDPVEGPLDTLKLWFSLPNLNGLEREEAIEALDDWLRRR